jgi:ATP-dependent protease ClpP protease subunit
VTRQLPDTRPHTEAEFEVPTPPPALAQVPRLRYWGDRRPPKNRADMFSVAVSPRNATTDDPDPDTAPAEPTQSVGSVATIRLYGPIDSWGGWWGISAADVSEALDGFGDDVDEIRVRINSPGGEAWEGMTILNMLRAHRAKVVAVVDGVAASAASFIAAGVEETVMSPGTQMMIHDASNFAIGNAAFMRKNAEFLDSISDAIASVYTGAAGGTDQQWRALMVEETWYTAKEATTAGLADRVAVVPDAGTTTTAGANDPDPFEDVEDAFDLSIYNYAGRSHAPAPKLPTSSGVGTTSAATAAGDTSQEGAAAVFNDEQLTTLRQKLGVSDDADADTVIGALDEALAERAETTTTAPGTVAVDEGSLDQLRRDAAAGREARNAQLEADRVALVRDAVNDGRIPPARRDHWLAQLRADDEGARAALAGLTKGTIPVDELGTADAADDKSVNDLYNEVFPEHQKES